MGPQPVRAFKPIYRLIGLSLLALYDIVGDLTFLFSFPRYPLAGRSFNYNFVWRVKEVSTSGSSSISGWSNCSQVVSLAESAISDYMDSEDASDPCRVFLSGAMVQKGSGCTATTAAPYRYPVAQILIYPICEYGTYCHLTSEKMVTQQGAMVCMHKLEEILQWSYYQSDITTHVPHLFASQTSEVEVKRRFKDWDAVSYDSTGSSTFPMWFLQGLAASLLAAIITKETLKVAGIISFFFHSFVHHLGTISIIVNSPAAIVPLLFSPRFRTAAVLMMERSQAGGSLSPWPLLWDILLQDLPQLALPFIVVRLAPATNTRGLLFFTLSGSITKIATVLTMMLGYQVVIHKQAPIDFAGGGDVASSKGIGPRESSSASVRRQRGESSSGSSVRRHRESSTGSSVRRARENSGSLIRDSRVRAADGSSDTDDELGGAGSGSSHVMAAADQQQASSTVLSFMMHHLRLDVAEVREGLQVVADQLINVRGVDRPKVKELIEKLKAVEERTSGTGGASSGTMGASLTTVLGEESDEEEGGTGKRRGPSPPVNMV